VSGRISVFNNGRLSNFLVFLMDSNSPNYQDEILNFVRVAKGKGVSLTRSGGFMPPDFERL
jgi:hypothetical protein